MYLSIKALENATNPIEIVNLLGSELYKLNNGNYATDCPKCSSKLYIIDNEFVCENNACVFRAGGVVDYLVAANHCTWDSALSTLNTIISGRLNSTTILKDKEIITRELKNRRRVFDMFLRLGLASNSTNISSIQYRGAIRAQGLDPDLLRWSVFIANSAEVEEINKSLSLIGVNTNLSGNNILLPYFADHHTVSHIVALKSPTDKPIKIAVIPHRTSFFGLLQRHPKCGTVHVANSYAAAAKLNTFYGRNSPELICLHMNLDILAQHTALTLKGATYVSSGAYDTDDLRTVATLQRYVPSLSVQGATTHTSYSGEQCVVASNEFILQCIIRELKKGNNILNILPLLDLTPANRHELLLQLHNARYFTEADMVRSYFKTLPIYSNDKITLFSNAGGYTLKKNNADTFTTHVSNFTIELEQNIVFAESTDIFHTGNVTFNNNTYPVTLKQEELDRAADLERAARRATLGVSSEDCENIPTIKERGGVKYVTAYLREQLASLPKTEGIPMLGWSPRRSAFYSPNFIANSKGTRAGAKQLHPGIGVLSSYARIAETESKLFHDLPVDIVNIVNQAAAFIIRSFLSMPVRPILVYNNSEARRLLSGVFTALGQVTAVQLNNNIRGEELSGLRGFPFYSAGYTQAQANKSSLPSFVLCDSGLQLTQTYETAIIDKARQTLNFVVRHVVEWALRTNAECFEQQHSVSRANAYSIEGANVIMTACEIDSWPFSKTPFENLDSLLSLIKFGDVKQYFIKDINTHMVRIQREAIAIARDQLGLRTELQTLTRRLVDDEDDWIVDSESMTDTLHTFYHNAPVLSERFNADALLRKVH